MRLLFINRYFYPDTSATAQILTELAEDLRSGGDTVTVITGRSAYQGGQSLLPAEEMHKGIRILRITSSYFGRRLHAGRLIDYLSFYAGAMWTALRLSRHDRLVVLSDPPLLSVLAAIVGLIKQCKTVCWMQDVFPDIAVQAQVLPEGRVAAVLQSFARWSLTRMDRIVVLGRCMEQRLQALGLPQSKMARVANWADGSQIRPMDRRENTLLDDLGLRDRFVVMYSGNFGIVHEYDTVRAMIAGLRHMPDICFCFIGDGYYRNALAREAEQAGWTHVLFLPYQKKDRLRLSLTLGDIHLVSLRSSMVGCSVPSKTYGILAAGRPILYVGPARSEIALLIREAGCGDVVEPGDSAGAIQAVLTGYRDRKELNAKGLAGRSYFELNCDRSIQSRRFRGILDDMAA